MTPFSLSALERTNMALFDEIVAINAIHGEGTLVLDTPIGPAKKLSAFSCILTFPDPIGVQFRINFPVKYPNARPQVVGQVYSRNNANDKLYKMAQQIVENAWTAGDVCIDVLIDGIRDFHAATSRFHSKGSADNSSSSSKRSTPRSHTRNGSVDGSAADNWTASAPLSMKKSVFQAHAAPTCSVDEAKEKIQRLISSNRKLAEAKHNITAWRITCPRTGHVHEDANDDGERGASLRLLHLLQITDAIDVVVVVTRWFGGIELGPARFQLINQAANTALTDGGYIHQKPAYEPKGKKGGRNGRK